MNSTEWLLNPYGFFKVRSNYLPIKAKILLDCFQDKTLNGFCGIETEVSLINAKATAIITHLDDNPGIDMNIIFNVIVANAYYSLFRKIDFKNKHQAINANDILWFATRGDKIIQLNFKNIPKLINGKQIILFKDFTFTPVTLKEFKTIHSQHIASNELEEQILEDNVATLNKAFNLSTES